MSLVNTRLGGIRIIHSELLDGTFDQLALKLAKEQVIAGYYGIDKPGRVGSVLLHLLIYQIVDGTSGAFFPDL